MRRKARILIVEDNSHDMELIKLALSEQVVISELILTSSGEEALEELFGEGKVNTPPDLILLDLHLPNLSGQEVIKRIRGNAATQDVPIVVFTSSVEEKHQMESYNLGANAYIRKFIDPDEFKMALENLDIYWLIKDE